MFLSLALTFIVFCIGTLIGGVGIGGVLLAPALKYLGGFSLHAAIPACILSYVATGIIGVIIFARHGTINWSMAMMVCAGALPGAYMGAFLLPYFSTFVLELGIALLIVASGIHALRNRGEQTIQQVPHSGRLVVIGLLTGVGSALSGTGGPLLLIPVLVWIKVPILIAIGLSQAVQIPISLTATLGNFVHGQVNFPLALTLALTMAGGTLVGAKVAHVVPVALK